MLRELKVVYGITLNTSCRLACTKEYMTVVHMVGLVVINGISTCSLLKPEWTCI